MSTFPIPLAGAHRICSRQPQLKECWQFPRRNPHAYQIELWELVLLKNSPDCLTTRQFVVDSLTSLFPRLNIYLCWPSAIPSHTCS